MLKATVIAWVLASVVTAAPPLALKGRAVSPDGSCGGSQGYICPIGSCCSQYGWWYAYFPLPFRKRVPPHIFQIAVRLRRIAELAASPTLEHAQVPPAPRRRRRLRRQLPQPSQHQARLLLLKRSARMAPAVVLLARHA